MKRVPVAAVVLVAAASVHAFAAPPAPPQELSLPVRLSGHIRIVQGKVDGRTAGTTKAVGDLLGTRTEAGSPLGETEPMTSAIVSINIRRWTLGEEREALAAAFRARGTAGLVKELDKTSLGELHFNSELRVPIRAAVTWITATAQHVQLVFNRRVVPANPANALARHDLVVHILDLSLPHGEADGTGTLVTATQVELQEPGLVALVVPETGSGMSMLDHVEPLPAKPR